MTAEDQAQAAEPAFANLVPMWCPSCEEEFTRAEGTDDWDVCPVCHLTPMERL